jgi:uncharacterized protein YpiB (UPF0302 family)
LSRFGQNQPQVWAALFLIRHFVEQSEQTGRDLHLSDHASNTVSLKDTLPASSAHVVMARFEHIRQNQPKFG